VLGGVFLVLETVQWSSDLKESTWTKDAYSSFYYSITGLHDVHVAVGILMLAFALLGALRHRYGPRRREHVHLVALYWYFNVLVWVAIYAAVYLSPRW
jgi:cytochrome c oxidase subunit 3